MKLSGLKPNKKHVNNYLFNKFFILFFIDDTVFAEVEKAEQNMINDLDKKSRSKPLLVFHDESNVINACDIISEMALNGEY